jgi:uncharacterized protein YbjT (DUF2867 family)
MRLAVAGGTGAVGLHVVAEAQAAGHETVVLSRANGVDLLAPVGLAERLAGVDAVLDVTSTGTLRTEDAVRFFTTVTDALLAAEREAGVPHHVALSIIGAAGATDGYYAGKQAQEARVMAADTGWSILRAAQFHEFAQQMAARPTSAGLLLVARMRSQPIAAVEVAHELVRIAAHGPGGVVPDLAGPAEESMPALVRRYLRATGRRTPVVALPLPGDAGRRMRDGRLLPGPGARLGAEPFDEWLADTLRTR